jgi:hypothetical protein
MPAPTRKQLLEWAEGYVKYWNSGQREAWIANWKKVAPGDFVMLDPVGTKPKRGFENCAAGPYQLFQPNLTLYVDPSTRFICSNEVAWVMQNTFRKGDDVSVLKSIEVFRFGEDGSVEVRTHYDVPDESDRAAGALFQEYLPER